MKIIKNCLKKEEAYKIKDLLTSQSFPWFYIKGIVFEEDNNYQFTHMFYNNFNINSNYFNILEPIINILNPSSIIKIKANLLVKDKKITEHSMHVDVNTKHSKTAVYYVNTNDGYTKFENNKIIKSEMNKLITFDSNIKHCGTSCSNEDFRIVINFNYFE